MRVCVSVVVVVVVAAAAVAAVAAAVVVVVVREGDGSCGVKGAAGEADLLLYLSCGRRFGLCLQLRSKVTCFSGRSFSSRHRQGLCFFGTRLGRCRLLSDTLSIGLGLRKPLLQRCRLGSEFGQGCPVPSDLFVGLSQQRLGLDRPSLGSSQHGLGIADLHIQGALRRSESLRRRLMRGSLSHGGRFGRCDLVSGLRRLSSSRIERLRCGLQSSLRVVVVVVVVVVVGLGLARQVE